MNSGLYGTVRPAIITPSEDVEIHYAFRKSLSEPLGALTPLSSNYLESTTIGVEGSTGDTDTINGLYNLRLPLSDFNEKGFYTIYIRPKEIKTTIFDVGILAADPDVIGLVFKINSLDLGDSVDLTGYRVEYYDSNNKPTGVSRLITSCNRCEQTRIILSDNYTKTIRYNLNAASSNNLLFCTITPSSSNSFNPNVAPETGRAGDSVRIINTKFNPVLMEIEMVEHDAETISTMLEGAQVRDLDNGIITTYTNDKEIYKQHEYYTIKSQGGIPLYEVKDKKTDIDTSQKFSNIVTE